MRSIALLLCVLAPASVIADEPPSLSDAIRRGISVVERQGVAWIKERDCVSCHQVPSMLWTLGEAHQRGLYDHPKKLADWAEWSLHWENWNNPMPDQTEEKVVAGNIDTMTSLILSYPASLPGGKDKKAIARFVDHIVRLQKNDGSWKSGGQLPLQKRPKEESGQVTTMWTVLALDASHIDNDGVKKARTRALKYISNLKPGKSTEWWVTRWLIERNRDNKNASDLLDKLRKFQHKDGGWGWLHNDPSDAFGTALALYALTTSGTDADRTAIQRARDYLLRTQNEDGSWATKSTLARRKTRVIPTSEDWATAWATLALMSTMEK